MPSDYNTDIADLKLISGDSGALSGY